MCDAGALHGSLRFIISFQPKPSLLACTTPNHTGSPTSQLYAEHGDGYRTTDVCADLYGLLDKRFALDSADDGQSWMSSGKSGGYSMLRVQYEYSMIHMISGLPNMMHFAYSMLASAMPVYDGSLAVLDGKSLDVGTNFSDPTEHAASGPEARTHAFVSYVFGFSIYF